MANTGVSVKSTIELPIKVDTSTLDQLSKALKTVKSLSDSTKDSISKLSDSFKSLNDTVRTSSGSTLDALKQIGSGADSVGDRFKSMHRDIQSGNTATQSSMDGLGRTVDRLGDRFTSNADKARRNQDVLKNYGSAIKSINKNTTDSYDTFGKLDEKMDGMSTTYQRSTNSVKNLANQTLDAVRATEDLRKVMHGITAPNIPIKSTFGPAEQVERTETKSAKGIGIGGTAIGAGIGASVATGLSSIGSYFKSQATSALQADQAVQQLQLSWHTMGVSSGKDIQSLLGQVGDLTKQANISGADTTAVQKSLYNATNGNVNETKALTNEMFAFGKATGVSDDQIVQASGSLGRMFNTAKVRGNTFTRITKQMPAMRNAIIKASGESSTKFMADMNAGKVSGQELQDLMVKAAKYSGQAWQQYGQTAQGALARLQGSQSAIWKATMKGIAGETNSGLVQLSQLISKNIKPISQMMIGVGNAGAKVVDAAITFLVNNQKPLGEIAHSLITIIGTIGSTIWKTFSTILETIGKMFGFTSDQADKSSGALDTLAGMLKAVADHQGAIKALTAALTAMFMIDKALKFASALKEVAGATMLMGQAEQSASGTGGGLGGMLTNLFQNQTMAGRMFRGKGRGFSAAGAGYNTFDNISFGKSTRTLAKGIKNTDLASKGAFKGSYKVIDSGVSSGLYKDSLKDSIKNGFTVKNIGALDGASLGSYAADSKRIGLLGKLRGLLSAGAEGSSKLSRFGKIGNLVGAGATAVKGSSLFSKIGEFASNSKFLTGAGKLASRIPFLDVAAAGTQLIGMNRHNAGSKVGSAGGMLGGTLGGAALGTAIMPGIGTAIGGAIGGIGGSSIGKWIGKKVQGFIPKDLFKGIGKSWNSAVNAIKKSSVGKSVSNSFNKMKSSIGSSMSEIGKSFRPVGKDFGNFINAAKKSVIVKSILKGIGMQFRAFGDIAKVALKAAFSIIKGLTIGIGTFLKDEFSGIFKAIGGIFKAGADLLTGHWSKLGSDLKQIGSGILDALTAPFKGAWAAIKSIGTDIINSVESIWSSIKSMGSKVASIARHPIKSIESMFASGTQASYPNGLPKATRAVVNDGAGPELINFGNNYGMFKGRNVQTVLPKGAKVYNAQQTQMMVGVQHFAAGTQPQAKFAKTVKIGNNPIDTKGSQQELKKFRRKNIMSWQNIGKDTGKQTNQISKDTGKTYQATSDNVTTIAGKMSDSLIKITSSMADSFNKILQTLPQDAQAAMQSVVNALNQGIAGIDSALQQFGGNGDVLKPFHYATGSDGKLPNDQFAMVNDATSGPIQEAIVRDGSVYLPKHRNQLMRLSKGDAVLNGTQTQKLINNYSTINHYAKGSGMSDSALEKIAQQNNSNPAGAYNAEMGSKITPNGPALQKGLISTISGAIKNTGVRWESAMWHVINSAMGTGGSGGPLYDAMKKYGDGHRYVWATDGPDTFDCSGLVKYAAQHAYGISLPHFSGSIMGMTHKVSRDAITPGVTLVGNNEHIGVMVDKDHYYSAFNPSSHPNILETPFNSSYFPGTPIFGNLPGIPTSSNKGPKIKVNGALQSLAKSELGATALKWITKHLNTSDGGGSSANPAGDGVQRWKPDVIKALSALGLSTSAGMVQKVLTQINTESGGNPNAVGGTDGLSDGRAMGLMQVKPGTFSAYGKSGLGKWNNGYASLYAGLNYAKHRYGDSLSFLGQGHGYANGGWATHPAVFGEAPGQPEVAINPKRNSADRLIHEAINARQRVTGKPFANKLRGERLRQAGHSLFAKAIAAVSGRDKRDDHHNVTVNNNVTINVDGGKHDAKEIARIVAEKLQELSYNTYSKLHLNVD